MRNGYGMTRKEVEQYARRQAKKAGLTFKKGNYTLNNEQGYIFTDRETGATVLSTITLGGGYNNVCSGFIATYNKSTRSFDGL